MLLTILIYWSFASAMEIIEIIDDNIETYGEFNSLCVRLTQRVLSELDRIGFSGSNIPHLAMAKESACSLLQKEKFIQDNRGFETFDPSIFLDNYSITRTILTLHAKDIFEVLKNNNRSLDLAVMKNIYTIGRVIPAGYKAVSNTYWIDMVYGDIYSSISKAILDHIRKNHNDVIPNKVQPESYAHFASLLQATTETTSGKQHIADRLAKQNAIIVEGTAQLNDGFPHSLLLIKKAAADYNARTGTFIRKMSALNPECLTRLTELEKKGPYSTLDQLLRAFLAKQGIGHIMYDISNKLCRVKNLITESGKSNWLLPCFSDSS